MLLWWKDEINTEGRWILELQLMFYYVLRGITSRSMLRRIQLLVFKRSTVSCTDEGILTLTGRQGPIRAKTKVCGKGPESVAHILAGCGVLVQTKYIERHNNALKTLFFEVIRSLYNSYTASMVHQVKPKPIYENERVGAFWDVLLFADNTLVKANRIVLVSQGRSIYTDKVF